MAVELTQAAQVLQDRFGARLEETQDGGRRRMVSALREALGLGKAEAKELVDVLIEARTVRWQTDRTGQATVPKAQTPPAEALGATNLTGLPLPADLPLSAGYWQLSPDDA